jgi:hypothetical protein
LATISTPNDPNRDPNKPVTVSTGNVAPQAQPSNMSQPGQAPAQPAASGQYSTLQKYLGANQDAGQRIASQVGGNIQNEAQNAATTSQRELGQAAGANTAFDTNIAKANSFTAQLNTPATQQSNAAPTAKAYDVNSYSTNLSGQQAAKDIASNTDKLNEFKGYASGDTLAKNRAESDKQQQEAAKATDAELKKNQTASTNINTESGRGKLLNDVFNNQNYRSGLKQLDQAFLQNDKSNTLNQISNNLKSNVATIQKRNNDAAAAKTLLEQLTGQGNDAVTGLTNRTTEMNKQYEDSLNARLSNINQAKDDRLTYLKNQFADLRDNNQAKQSFLDELGLTAPQVTDQKTLNSWVGSQPTGTSGTRLFKTVKDLGGLGDILNTQTLEDHALTKNQAANQADVDNLKAIYALMGDKAPTDQITQASNFQGNQTSNQGITGGNLAERLAARTKDFQDKDLAQRFNSEASATEGVMSDSGLLGRYQTGTANASAGATATLADYLYGNGIAREVQSGETQNLPGFTGLIPSSFVYDSNHNASGQYFRDPNQLANNARNREIDRVRNTAESQAVSGVNSQINNQLNSIGYQNLLKILQES